MPSALDLPPSFDFRRLWHALTEKLWVVALCVIAGLFLALGYLARTPKLYQAHIILEVDVQEPTLVPGEDSGARMRSTFLSSQEAMRTIEQNFTNRTLLARVVRAEGLTQDQGRALLGYSAGDPVGATPAPTRGAAIGPSDEPAAFAPMNFTQLEEGLGGAMSAMVKPVVRRGTRLIDLFFVHRDPALAQRLVEAVGREYIRNSIERRASFNQQTLRYLIEEEERLKKHLQKSESAVAEYKATTPDALQLGGGAGAVGSQQGAGSSGGRGGMVEDKLQELNSKLTAAKTERVRLESELSQIADLGDNIEGLIAIPSIGNSGAVIERRRDVAQLEAQVASLAQRYKEKHPKMTAARAALTEAQAALRRTVLAQPATVKSLVEQARAAEENLATATRDQEKAALALNKAAIGYQELARQAETDRALYESVLRQIKETNLTKDVKTNAVSIVEHAQLPHSPVTPNTSRTVAMGLIGGLLAGLVIVYGLEAIDRSVKTVDQAEAIFRLPVLAAIPEVRRGAAEKETERRPKRRASYRLLYDAPETPAAESFRNLRAALALLGPENERKVFLFTSALPGEGKSFTSANYALALAQQGHRVLLIDGDLRRPSLEKILLAHTGAKEARRRVDLPGIVECLVGTCDLDTAVRPMPSIVSEGATGELLGQGHKGGKVCVLGAGRRAPNPAELLGSHSFSDLIEEAARSFDRIVIDSAPVLAVSDTLLMIPYVQTVSLVVRSRKTPRNAVQRAIALLHTAGSHAAGVVLNRMPRRHGKTYYYYYASPGYGNETIDRSRSATDLAATTGSNASS